MKIGELLDFRREKFLVRTISQYVFWKKGRPQIHKVGFSVSAKGDNEEQEKLLKKSCTLYVGNLSFYTTEEQIYELFSKSGDIKKIIMGLDKMKKTACGFCFVEYYSRADAENAMRYINGTRLDDRIIRTDWDAGFKEGRQYGRGRSGGQVRDEYRQDYDAGRGGYGKLAQNQ